MNEIFHSKWSKDLLTSLVEEKLNNVNKVSSMMLRNLALKKEEKIRENVFLFHKIERQN